MSRPPATVRCDSIREARLRSFHTCIAPPLEPTGTGCKMNRTNLLDSHGGTTRSKHIRL
jgi:hypothetical protein